MSVISSDEVTLKAGTFVYTRSVTCQLRLVRSGIRHAPAEPTKFVSRSGAYPSLQTAARGAAEHVASISW